MPAVRDVAPKEKAPLKRGLLLLLARSAAWVYAKTRETVSPMISRLWKLCTAIPSSALR